MQVVDLTALGAQAAAQVERARQAAREQVQLALRRRPKLEVHLDFDAPKVAVPVPACSATGEGATSANESCFWQEGLSCTKRSALLELHISAFR